jgi:hypothetical protein
MAVFIFHSLNRLQQINENYLQDCENPFKLLI